MIDKIFYIIYNSYYKHGEYKNDIPPLTVFGIFFYSIYSIIMLTVTFIDFIFDSKTYFSHGNQTFFKFVMCGLITFFAFYYRKRYQAIYNRYKDNGFYNSKKAKFLAFTFIILVCLSPMIFAILSVRIKQGVWVTFS